jgi:hypothetical protein
VSYRTGREARYLSVSTEYNQIKSVVSITRRRRLTTDHLSEQHMDQDESMDNLVPILGYGCGFCSAFCKYPDLLGFRLQGNLACAEIESECCRPTNKDANPHLKKDESMFCMALNFEVSCHSAKTCIGGQAQIFCFECRTSLPTTFEVPCLTAICGLTLCFKLKCVPSCCKNMEQIQIKRDDMYGVEVRAPKKNEIMPEEREDD